MRRLSYAVNLFFTTSGVARYKLYDIILVTICAILTTTESSFARGESFNMRCVTCGLPLSPARTSCPRCGSAISPPEGKRLATANSVVSSVMQDMFNVPDDSIPVPAFHGSAAAEAIDIRNTPVVHSSPAQRLLKQRSS